MRSRAFFVSFLPLCFLAIFLAFTRCGGGDSAPRKPAAAAAVDAKTNLEEASGLRTDELALSEHALWQDEGEKSVVINYNAGPECAKATCLVKIETSDRPDEVFRPLGDLFDGGDSGDLRAKDGIYSRTIVLDAKTYPQMTIRFRAQKQGGPLSNVAYLSVGPRIGAPEIKEIKSVGDQYDATFKGALGNKTSLAALATQIAAEPGISTAVVSLDADAILIVHKKGVIGVLAKEAGPNIMAGGGNGLTSAIPLSFFTRRPTCGGWAGEIVQVSPYAHQFQETDSGLVMTEALKSDPKERFRVQSFNSTGAGTGSIDWFSNLFDKTNGAVVTTHGTSLRFAVNNIPKTVKYFGSYSADGTTWVLNGMSTNHFVSAPTEKESKLFAGSIFVFAKTGEAHLKPQFFSNQRR